MTLPELVAARRRELGLSYRDVSAGSGGLVSYSRVATIEAGEVSEISDRVLEGLAAGLDLSLSRVRRAAGVPVRDRPFEIPARANRLNARERRLVLALIDTLLAAHDGES